MASQVSPGPLVRSSKGIRRVEEAELTICYKLFYFCVVPYNLERLLYPCAVVPEPLVHWEPSMISVLGILIRASQRLPTCPKAHILCYRVRLRVRSSDPWSGSLSTVTLWPWSWWAKNEDTFLHRVQSGPSGFCCSFLQSWGGIFTIRKSQLWIVAFHLTGLKST